MVKKDLQGLDLTVEHAKATAASSTVKGDVPGFLHVFLAGDISECIIDFLAVMVVRRQYCQKISEKIGSHSLVNLANVLFLLASLANK